jgi:hypothetical protein
MKGPSTQVVRRQDQHRQNQPSFCNHNKTISMHDPYSQFHAIYSSFIRPSGWQNIPKDSQKLPTWSLNVFSAHHLE